MAINELLANAVKEIKYKKGITQAQIAAELGVKSTYLSDMINGRVPLSENISYSIKNLYGISLRETGVGTIAQSPERLPDSGANIMSSGKVVPYYDAEVAAGTSYGMEMTQTRPFGMIEIGGLMKDSEFALRVYGNSMTPNYPAGCVVGLKQHTESFIEPGTVYVVETQENRYLKRLYCNKDKTALRCLSDNHMKHENGPMEGEYYYPEFEIPFSEVRRLLRVTGVIKRNIL